MSGSSKKNERAVGPASRVNGNPTMRSATRRSGSLGTLALLRRCYGWQIHHRVAPVHKFQIARQGEECQEWKEVRHALLFARRLLIHLTVSMVSAMEATRLNAP